MSNKARLVGTVVPLHEPPPTWTVTLYVLIPKEDGEPIVTTDGLYAKAVHVAGDKYDLYTQEMEIRR